MANSCSGNSTTIHLKHHGHYVDEDESFDVSSSLLCRNYTKQLTDLRDDGTYICVSNSTGTAHQRHTVIVQGMNAFNDKLVSDRYSYYRSC